MTEIEKMNKGLLHNFLDEEISDLKKSSQELLKIFNSSDTTEEERHSILKQLFKSVGNMSVVVPPFKCDYGAFIQLGNRCFLNYDCIILDGCDVKIGDNVFIGPRTIITTASHPLYAPVRIDCLGIQNPIVIEDNVWIGAGCIILPGAVIGENTVIGAGSVVTGAHSIPANSIAVGNPCKVIRNITDADREKWESLRSDYYNKK